MPFISTNLSEGNFLTELTEILTTNGEEDERWKLHAKFTRVAYSLGTDNPLVCAAKHYIFKSPLGDLFGIAVTSDVFQVNTTNNLLSLGKSRLESDKRLLNLYLYTVEKFDLSDNVDHVIGTNYPVLRKALDVEYIFTNKPETYQSPIIPITLRKKDDNEKFFGSDKKYANWWEDSRVRITGYFDNGMLIFTIKADNAPSWSNYDVPRIPIFFGRFEAFGKDYSDNVALFAGTYNSSSNTDFEPIFPIGKNYYPSPGNGISNVIVRKTKYGSRYQAHYLSSNTPPKLMPPNIDDYPQYNKPAYHYQYNPSKYSDEIHASLAYIVHPEHGVYGFLPNIILTEQLSILDGDILDVQSWKCHVWNGGNPHSHWEHYLYREIDSVSPLTIPGTIHKTAGLGIITHKKSYEKEV
jgi:hypothetical protein